MPRLISLRFKLVAIGAMLALGWIARAQASPTQIAFPENYAAGVHYATVVRGDIREELFVNRPAIQATKAGRLLPSGTVIAMEDWRNGKLFRYVVMEKRDGWGRLRPLERRNGDWSFQAFNADRSINRDEDLERCFACHKPQAANDFVFTLDFIKALP